MDYIRIPKKLDNIAEGLENTIQSVKELSSTNMQQMSNLNDFSERIKQLAKKLHIHEAITVEKNDNGGDLDAPNGTIFKELLDYGQLTDQDKELRLNKIDYLIASLAGGGAVLVDFLIVGIPKDMKFTNKGETIYQKGSSLTQIIRQIGTTKDGKEAKWVKSLEKWFKVPYDKSIDPLLKHFYPKNHRAFSLGHEPSLSGFIWGVKDIISSTFSSVDQNGILHIEKISETNYLRLFYAPILWLGHIISDVFTTMGVPIPGNSFLRLLQFGSFGENERTIAQISEYMFLNGYDLRHFATMSISNAVIWLITSIYFILTRPNVSTNIILAENEYKKIKFNQKQHSVSYIAYSVAVCGNIAKVAIFQGNPNAINASIWLKFIKESIRNIEMIIRDQSGEKAIENRHVIDENFRILSENLI